MADMPQPLKEDAGGTKFACFWFSGNKYPAVPRALHRRLIDGEFYSWAGVGGGYDEILVLNDQAVTDLWTASGTEIVEARGYNRVSAFLVHDGAGLLITLRFYRRLAQTGTVDYLPALEFTGIPAGNQVRDMLIPASPFLKPEVVIEGGGTANVTLTVLLSYS